MSRSAPDPPLPIRIKAEDGLELAASYFDHPQAKAAVLICCATAVRQRFYWPFARWLNQAQYKVLTFDYRGIGESTAAPISTTIGSAEARLGRTRHTGSS